MSSAFLFCFNLRQSLFNSFVMEYISAVIYQNFSLNLKFSRKKGSNSFGCFSTGFGWDRVKFLHSNLYGTMFWICAENSVDNTLMF